MMKTRREFLKIAGCLCGGLALQSLAPRLVQAQSLQSGAGKNLIVINLGGGCDGVQLLPYYTGPLGQLAQSLRPTIYPSLNTILPGHAQNGIQNKIGIHPALAPIAGVIRSHGKIIQSYGILQDPGRSHDYSSLLMELGASRSTVARKGFLARLADSGDYGLFQYWGLRGTGGSIAFNTDRAIPIVVDELESFDYPQLWTEDGPRDQKFLSMVRSQLVETEAPGDALKERYKKTARTMHRAVSRIRTDISTQIVGGNIAGNYDTTDIGYSLRDAAKILRSKGMDLSIRDKSSVIYVEQGGYDHHSGLIEEGQGESFSELVGSLALNLSVLIEDLRIHGAWDKTAIVLFSEFGRTTRQNGSVGELSVGTDHGWGSNTIVLSGAITGGTIGDAPSLGELQDSEVDALIPQIDYRDIFSDAIRWLGGDPGVVFTEEGYTSRNLGIFT